MLRFLVLFVLLCGSSVNADAEANEVTAEPEVPQKTVATIVERGSLIADLFNQYDRRNYPANFTLRFGATLIKLEVNELLDTLDTDIWMRMAWTDPRLEWNPSDYGGQDNLRIASSEVWKPDLRPYNAEASLDGFQCAETNAVIKSNGTVLIVSPCHFRTSCKHNLTLDPYGEQTCKVTFGSWTFDQYTMDLQFYGEAQMEVDHLVDVTDWEVVRTSAKRNSKTYKCCSEPYVDITYELTFKRKPNKAHCHL